MSQNLFVYDDVIIHRYPGIRAGVVHANGLLNGPSTFEQVSAFETEQRSVLDKLGGVSLGEIPSIAAWRRAFSQFGVKPTQYRNAAEALLRRLTKQGDIPSINSLVDMGNVVSIRYAMPVAVVDLAGIENGITVRLATGDESFTDLGATEPSPPEPGEVVFVDGGGVVCARRWCWRQSAQSATGASTGEALFVIEGHHDGAAGEIDAAVEDLTGLLATYQPQSQVRTEMLSPNHSRMPR
jgi:DNA/RNA-binding domain of Phe-tRNA-synthetase-like protein